MVTKTYFEPYVHLKFIFKDIGMISKGSCDSEDWSNDAENQLCFHRNKLHFKVYENRKQLF